jgi:hypothetical protein
MEDNIRSTRVQKNLVPINNNACSSTSHFMTDLHDVKNMHAHDISTTPMDKKKEQARCHVIHHCALCDRTRFDAQGGGRNARDHGMHMGMEMGGGRLHSVMFG